VVRRRSWGWCVAAIVATVAAALGLAACGSSSGSGSSGNTSSSGGGTAKASLTLGYVTTEDHPYGVAVDYYRKLVSDASGGAIQIKGLPSYQGGDVPLLQDVRSGAVDMGSISSAVWGTQGVKDFDALQALGLITRYDLEKEIIAGPIGAKMLAATSKIGLKGLAIHEGGLRKPIGAKSPINSPADFKGKTIRVPESDVLQTGMRALGADPTAIPVTDIYAAMRDGTVDGMEANLGLIQTLKLYEVAKYITANVNLWPFPTVIVMNQAKFDALTPDQQNILVTEAKKVPGFSIDFFSKPSALPKTLCDEGMKFSVASPADLASFDKVSQAVIAQMSKDPTTKGYIDQIEKLKSALPAPPAPAALPQGCTVTAK
jgi:TRAP-type transport system periplasmic protein